MEDTLHPIIGWTLVDARGHWYVEHSQARQVDVQAEADELNADESNELRPYRVVPIARVDDIIDALANANGGIQLWPPSTFSRDGDWIVQARFNNEDAARRSFDALMALGFTGRRQRDH